MLSLLRGVASLLNGRGGTVLIGALEAGKHGNYDCVKELPKLGRYHFHGVKEDCAGGDWDDFAMQLKTVFGKRLDPDAREWLKFHYGEHEDKEVCMVQISEPDEWFYVQTARRDKKFYVRDSNGTNELTGSQITRYMEEHPRRSRY